MKEIDACFMKIGSRLDQPKDPLSPSFFLRC
jgi:hypothetical protein